MAEFKVLKVINGDTIEVSPKWKWRERTGKQLLINGYSLPRKGTFAYNYATKKLSDLLLNKYVIIKKPQSIFDKEGNMTDLIYCDVYLNNVNVAKYFPEYRVK